MPTIVIHQIGAPAQVSNWDTDRIRVGRDPSANDLVLSASTVSREHAIFGRTADGRWMVKCVSEKNPIVVDGAVTSAAAFVSEGSEVMVGSSHLLIFAETAFAAQAYLGQRSYFSKSSCPRCHWTGMVSTLRRAPVCPKCGSADLRSETEYRRDTASSQASSQATAMLDPREMKAELARLKAARCSHVERIDGHDPAAPRKGLSESEVLRVGKAPGCHMKLIGFTIGKGFEVAWDGRHHVARSLMTWPSMKVNGVATKVARLSSGDLIEVGKNRFRFVTE